MVDHYSYKFREIRIGEAVVLRPMIQVKLTGPSRAFVTAMLVDSGADVSMIELDLAEQLGLRMGKVESTGGVSGSLPVFRSQVRAEIVYERQLLPPVDLPVQVPTERGLPPVALLGREVFFYEYDISFRMGYTPTKGKFVLAPVTRRRDASAYK